MSRRAGGLGRIALAILAGGLVVLLYAYLVGGEFGTGRQQTSSTDSSPVVDRTVFVLPNDSVDQFTPSTSLEDWAENAAHVVAVRVESEETSEPTPTEIERGEGLVVRTVTARVTRLVWSRPGTEAPMPPDTILVPSGGAFYKAEQSPRFREFVVEGTALLVPGHDYLLAIRLPRASCAADPGTANWSTLGVYSEIPFDDGVLGRGEFQGRSVTPAEFISMEDEVPGTPVPYAFTVIDNSLEEIAGELDSAAASSEGPCRDR